MTRTLVVRVATAVIGVALGAVLSAQGGRWQQPYDAGRRAIEAKRFEEAVKQLERAIAIDPRQEANKQVEGVFRADYFPYYYLGIAYFEMGQYAKAQENFNKAGERLSRNLTASLMQYQQQVAVALKKAAPPSPTPAVDTRFAQLLRDGDAALAARRYGDAINAFDAARGANAGEYARQGVQARRDQAARGRALELAAEGTQLMASSLPNARSRFEEAERTFPGLKETADGLAEIRRREGEAARATAASTVSPAGRGQSGRGGSTLTTTPLPAAGRTSLTTTPLAPGPAPAPREPAPSPRPDPARLFQDAVRLSKDGQYAEAETGYAAVLKADPAHREAADALRNSQRFGSLVSEGRAARDRGETATARQRFEEARKLDALRFSREGLTTVLAGLTAPAPADPTRESLRQGLQALLLGDTQKSIAILEPSVRRAGVSAANAAALHAYLGVAYATRALASPSADEQAKLRTGALEQFRQALAADKSYTLSSRLVSPKILAMFEEARKN
jgi:tetratricopeptide (TPR) repeat protein